MAYYNFKYPFALSEAQPSLMGEIAVPSQQTPSPSSTPTPTGNGKNDKLSLMLYALGGALKGDKNFMQNTLQLQQMQEGKKKEEQQKKNYQEFLKTINPDSPFYDLAKSIGHEGLPKLLLERYKAETKVPTQAEQKARILSKVQRGERLSKEDQKILDIIQSTDPIEIAIRRGLGDFASPDVDVNDVPENFKGTSEQWDALKKANPDFDDKSLIDFFNTRYGS